MKKRICAAMCMFLFALLFASSAAADVLWEPNDSFYNVSRDQCEILGRHFQSNSKTGRTTVYNQPGSGVKADDIPNGSELFVSFTYKDRQGSEWGVVQYLHDRASDTVTETYQSDGATTGWVLMDDLTLIYDHISFDEEHGKEFVPYSGDYDALRNAEGVIFWTYPGSGETVSTEIKITEDFHIEHAYTDPAGRQWGYVEYYFGYRSFWVCISDPSDPNLPANTPIPQPTLMPQATILPKSIDVDADALSPRVALIGILVLAVTGVTLVLIRLFWKKNDDNKNP